MFKIKFGSRVWGGLAALLVFVIIISVFSKSESDKLIGTWSYTYEAEYDEVFSVDAVINLEFTEDTYRWYIDEEKTESNLEDMYDSYISYHQITEDDVKAAGYESIESFKQQGIAESLAYFTEWLESENKGGTWKIDAGQFIFTETGDTTEYYTDYEIDDDVLILKTDGITLTKVS